MPRPLVNVDNDVKALMLVEVARHIAELETLVAQGDHTDRELVSLQQAIVELQQFLMAKAS
jgi:hypothetical protein